MNVVFWLLLVIIAIAVWISTSNAFAIIGSIATAIKERVAENLNNEDNEDKEER